MENIMTKVEGNILWIAVDMSKDFGPTKSGKALNVAKTNGYRKLVEVPGAGISLHVYKSMPKHEATS